MALDTLDLYMSTDEAAEGVAAFTERRPASFDRFR
jgi:1,4-dihydroxy-2-naphthoyl-CoA synthase